MAAAPTSAAPSRDSRRTERRPVPHASTAWSPNVPTPQAAAKPRHRRPMLLWLSRPGSSENLGRFGSCCNSDRTGKAESALRRHPPRRRRGAVPSSAAQGFPTPSAHLGLTATERSGQQDGGAAPVAVCHSTRTPCRPGSSGGGRRGADLSLGGTLGLGLDDPRADYGGVSARVQTCAVAADLGIVVGDARGRLRPGPELRGRSLI
jgi:hypothetical protein